MVVGKPALWPGAMTAAARRGASGRPSTGSWAISVQAGLQPHAGAAAGGAGRTGRGPLPVRGAAPPGPPAALRPAVRDRRRAGELGGAEGPDAGPGGPAAGRARRGPPDRVPRLRGRDPGRRVRRRRRDRLGHRHLGAGHGTDDPAAAVAAGRAARRGARARSCAAGWCWCAATGSRGGKEQWLLLHKRDEHAVRGWDPEDHPSRCSAAGRTRRCKADPDRLWRSDLPAARGLGRRCRRRRSSRATDGRAGRAGRARRRRHLARSSAGELRLTNLDKELFPAGRRAAGHQARAGPVHRPASRRSCCPTWPAGR